MYPSFIPLLFAGCAIAQTACNGNAAFCSRQWSNVSLVGTHDSAFVGDLPTDNQAKTPTEQLDAGIRFLQAQTHNNSIDFLDPLHLCHTSCLEKDAGRLDDYLSDIKTWLDANPNEVVTLLLTNGDNNLASDFGTAMVNSGLSSYAYAPSGQLALDEWPTLQELIDSNTRLIMFLDYGANITSVPYILDEFLYFFETAFDVTTPTFPSCDLNRPAGSSGAGLMYIVNHFLDLDIFGNGDILIPDTGALATTNAATGTGSIGAQAALCEQEWGRVPNLVLVDFFDTGDVFTAQNNLNGV
ncbi:hypothetical protein B7494_g4300 [Chlorociboria aeruginascens]|nr:hypothetical protein B7494_g4300 [Chlorociboria aeruginascens]